MTACRVRVRVGVGVGVGVGVEVGVEVGLGREGRSFAFKRQYTFSIFYPNTGFCKAVGGSGPFSHPAPS